MWDLEYALLFGVPDGKLELSDGHSRCVFPFLDRPTAEAHFTAWTEALCRWQGVAQPPRVKKAKEWKVEVEGFGLTLYPLPIDLRIPFDDDVFCTLQSSFWRRDLWPGQPAGCETGCEPFHRHADVQLNLWELFGTFCERYGGLHSGRVDIALSDTAAVAPDQFYYAAD